MRASATILAKDQMLTTFEEKEAANIRCVGWEEENVFIAVAEKVQTSPDLGKRTEVTCFRSSGMENPTLSYVSFLGVSI